MTDTNRPAAKAKTADAKPHASVLRPRDAGTLIVVDRSGGNPRVLFGRRHPNQAFVPDKFVFPGGRVEPADAKVATPHELRPRDEANLLFDMKGKPSPRRAKAMALAAIRETFEETGYLIGQRLDETTDPPSATAPWVDYFAQRVMPDPTRLRFVARAITPPARPRRYDTRFFLAFADDLLGQVGDGDGEFTELAWLSFEDARAVDLHAMTRTVLDDVAELLGPHLDPPTTAPVPYYYSRQGAFHRTLINAGEDVDPAR